MSSDPEIRAEYKARIREMNRIRAGQTVKYKEGLAKGEKIGIEKGANEKAVEIAKKMLADGMNIELTAKYSGLSIEEIKRL
ncbi:MAG: hypothetical protein IJ730_04945 [Alphaproteobacteria bacterium]|nr:hypothetical protein [Alphaproteobacteria bacterium]